MALTDQEKEEIAELIEKSVRQGLGGTCMCGLSPESQKEVGHFFGMIKDAGGGDLSRGVENVRETVKLILRIKCIGERVGVAIVVFVAVAVVGGIGSLIGLGIKSSIGK